MENLNAYTGIIVLFAILWAVQLYRAWKRFYRSDELFVRTPGHDMANVEKKHVRIWVKNAVAIVAVLFAIFVLNAMLDLYASEEVKRIFKNCENMLLVPFLLPSLVLGWDTRNYYLPSIFWDRKPYIVTRYMVYPERKISTVFATMVSCSIFGGLAAFVCGMSGQG
ncbi:MAG: hypothetical protein IKU25_03325, partial [Clostridia bacterium]|nr:hypothetical protein [Clostridia bacterium]